MKNESRILIEMIKPQISEYDSISLLYLLGLLTEEISRRHGIDHVQRIVDGLSGGEDLDYLVNCL